jgi:hypothetical protein
MSRRLHAQSCGWVCNNRTSQRRYPGRIWTHFFPTCPACGHNGAHVYICSTTVLTVRCADCAHAWCVDVRNLAPAVRSRLDTVLDGN